MRRLDRPFAVGPAAATVLLAAASLAPAVAAPIAFAYTGASQTFTAPTDGLYDIIADGAGGGSITDQFATPGGLGAEVSGHFVLTEGETLSVTVGGQGSAAPAGGGGGGGSFVILNGSSGDIPLLIAGGGGGAGAYASGTSPGGAGQAGSAGSGSGGGGAGGVNGAGGLGGGVDLSGPGDISGGGGGGGFVSGGGNGDAGTVRGGGGGGSYPGLAGGVSDGEGGRGGFGGGGGGGSDGGGGGGGGFSGGGGGGYGAALLGIEADYTAGGGGGSYNADLASTDATLVELAGVRSGDGEVTINLLPPPLSARDPAVSVPEPSSFALLGAASLLGLVRRRRRMAWACPR